MLRSLQLHATPLFPSPRPQQSGVVLAAHLPAEDTACCLPERCLVQVPQPKRQLVGPLGYNAAHPAYQGTLFYPFGPEWGINVHWNDKRSAILLPETDGKPTCIGHIAFEQFLVHLHKYICPVSLKPPVGSSFGVLHKSVWWRLTGYIWLAHISKTEQRTYLFVTILSRVGYPRRHSCHALKWRWLSVCSLKIKLCHSTCSIPLLRKPGWQEWSWSRVYMMQFYFTWNSKRTTRNKFFLHKAVAGKGEYIFQANCESSGNSWLAICSKWSKGEGRLYPAQTIFLRISQYCFLSLCLWGRLYIEIKKICFIFSEESVCYIICWLSFVHSLKNSRKRAFVLRTVKVRDFCFWCWLPVAGFLWLLFPSQFGQQSSCQLTGRYFTATGHLQWVQTRKRFEDQIKCLVLGSYFMPISN